MGVDLSETMITTAQARADAQAVTAEGVLGDATALSFADHSFDAVHCDRVLQHLDRPQAAIREMARVLVPGGRLMIKEPDWDGLFVDADDLVTTRAVRDQLVAHIRQPQIGRSLRRLVLAVGLEVVDFHGTLGIYAVSLAAADRVWNLRARLDGAVAVGAVDGDTAHAWWADLGARDEVGQFFAGVVGFRVVARKPA